MSRSLGGVDRWPDDGGDEEHLRAGPPDDWPPEAWLAAGWPPERPVQDGTADGGAEVAFEDMYDDEELAAIEAGPSRRRPDEPVTRVSQWRRRSALGAVLTGLALGLQEVFDPEDERSIVIEVDDDGLPTDLPVRVFLDPDSPAGSLCIVRRTGVKPPVV